MNIRRGNDDGLAQSPLALSSLRSQDVACKCVPALHLAGGGQFEALLCALVGLQLQLVLGFGNPILQILPVTVREQVVQGRQLQAPKPA